MMRDVTAVVAAASPHRGIGSQGTMPWRLPADLQHFKRVTSQPNQKNVVVMGRKTWQSLPPSFRPLPGRVNVVLSSNHQLDLPEGVLHAKSLDEAVAQVSNDCEIFIIGGGQVYQQAIEETHSTFCVNKVIYTEVEPVDGSWKDIKFDAFFPELDESEWTKAPFGDNSNSPTANNDKENSSSLNSFNGVDSKAGLRYSFWQYTRRQNTQEMQYLDLCRSILAKGVRRGDRTGTGTLSQFGTQMRFDLRNGTLPLLTTKRVFWRGVAEELLWFVAGNTNANDLAAKNIHIWDGNGSREFLDQRGLGHREEGDLGPVYGFQWRHFGAKYVDMHTDYTGQGVDQLADCIDKIKNNPEDRRIIMSAWNPADLGLMALPPCHMFCQFYVDTEKNELSCQMYQRSADMGLGVPFNIASYALLTHMVAHVTGRRPGDFVHTIGDAHVYLNHVEALEEQLKRQPRAFPKIKINPEKKNIDDFEFSDFEVIGYKPHKTIKMKMAV